MQLVKRQYRKGTFMTSMEEKNYTKCIVTDLMPGYILKKIVLVIRPTHTVQRVIDDLKCLLTYSEFDIILQPADETMDMVGFSSSFIPSYEFSQHHIYIS